MCIDIEIFLRNVNWGKSNEIIYFYIIFIF